MKAVEEARWSPEAARVHAWRFEWLKQAGYTESAAALLALRTDIDWHQASDLIRNCPEKVALKILL